MLIGAFLGTESPLTVTQMLWVNLIMDTFAAMALASLPPSMEVMQQKPRKREDFIVTKPMWEGILGLGLLFTAVLVGLVVLFQHCTFGPAGQESILQFAWADAPHELTIYQKSVFFTLFVMLQYWNMFNAKAFYTKHSALRGLGSSKGFLLVMVLILVGQVFIVSLGGQMFSVTPLSLIDWLLIIGISSLVFFGGELKRLITK